MQTLITTGSQHGQSAQPSSAGFHPTLQPTSPSTPGVAFASIFGSTIPRTSRRPSTSTGQAAADAASVPRPFSNRALFGEPPQEIEPSRPRSSRRAFTFGLGSTAAAGGGASGNILRKRSIGRNASLGDVPTYPLQQSSSQSSSQLSSPLVSRFKTFRRRANSTASLREPNGLGAAVGVGQPVAAAPPPPPPPAATVPAPEVAAVTNNGNPSVLPEYTLSSVATSSPDTNGISSPRPPSRSASNTMDSTGAFIQSGGRMISRSGTLPVNGSMAAGPGMMAPPPVLGMQSESAMVHQHIQEMANKRISTLEYLRKAYVQPLKPASAPPSSHLKIKERKTKTRTDFPSHSNRHEGRVYWFNTLLFDKPDLARMTYFDTRRLARRATNYLLLGLSLPTVIDLNSTTPLEFLRTFNLLLTEFDTFQSLHPESGGASSGLGRARIPNLNVFRRATPSAKSRRSSSANNDVLYEDGAVPNGGGSSGSGGSISGAPNGSGGGNGGGGGGSGSNGGMRIMNGLGGTASVVSFGQSEADLLPGEEYVHLLTPSLPFDPDFFETFATLCDVLIDAYTRLLSLLRTPRECSAVVAELFTKADARVRKIIVQGIVKEFEDTSRNGVRTEVANVGKIVLGGLM